MAPAARAPSLSQINLRVPRDIEEVLEAAAFVKSCRSIQQLLVPVVIEHAERLKTDRSVQAALRARNRESGTKK